jgi:hypothetical protein
MLHTILFQALPRLLFAKHSFVTLKKEHQIKMKIHFLASFLVIIIGFPLLYSFRFVTDKGGLLFLLFENLFFASSVYFTLTLVFCLFFSFEVDQSGLNFAPALLKEF